MVKRLSATNQNQTALSGVKTPVNTDDAANKAYVDTADALKVNKAGDGMTGQLTSLNEAAVGFRQTRSSVTTTWGTSSPGRFVVTSANGSVGLSLANAGLRIGDDSTIAAQKLDIAGNARINGVDYLVGTGSPNGVVSAPVGSLYVDKDATSGVTTWTKKTGTGNTGWAELGGVSQAQLDAAVAAKADKFILPPYDHIPTNSFSFPSEANDTVRYSKQAEVNTLALRGPDAALRVGEPIDDDHAVTKLYVDSLSGGGDVVGPSSAEDNKIALFDGNTGKLIKAKEGFGGSYVPEADAWLFGGGTLAAGNVLASGGVKTDMIEESDEGSGVTVDGALIKDGRIIPRVYTDTSTSTMAIDISSFDNYRLTAQASTLTISNPTGSPVDFDKIMISIKDNGTARAITWPSSFKAIGTTLPTTTTANKLLYVGAFYSAASSEWHVTAVTQEF